MKKLVALLGILVGIFVLTVWSSIMSAPEKTKASNEITVGVTAGPHEEVMEFVAKEAEKQGLTVKIVTFGDYVQPNIALAEKELDLNSFQHQPFLDNVVKEKGYKLVSRGKTYLAPMAIYSKSQKNVADVPQGAIVGIPNDPTNGARALAVLAQANLITLKEGVGIGATVADIVSNPKQLVIKELEAAQLVHSLNDVSLAVINPNYALEAGLNPKTDALFLETNASPYSNVIAARAEDRDNENYKKLVSIYQSEAVKQFILEHFKGTLVPTF